MALYGSSVEYGLHCLLYLVDASEDACPSARDLAEFQGVSPTYVAKVFTALEKADLVRSAEGVRGGFKLARPADAISVFDVVQALEGRKPLFQCKNVREKCVLFEGSPPDWATTGTCQIHAVMLDAEKAMLDNLKGVTLADITADVAKKIPATKFEQTDAWFHDRQATRRRSVRINDKTSQPKTSQTKEGETP